MHLIAFSGPRRLAQGDAAALRLSLAGLAEGPDPLLIFDLNTGQRVDLADLEEAPPAPRPGRPRLGVVSREVSLLPRHWEWLAAEPGGASAALRRLVDAARKADGGAQAARLVRDAGHKVLWAIAGDLPGFEAMSRAWFARDRAGVAAAVADWPPDLADLALGCLDRWLALGAQAGD
jgi:hypothetical protein